MKKQIYLIIGTLVLLFIVGCGKNSNISKTAESAAIKNSEETPLEESGR